MWKESFGEAVLFEHSEAAGLSAFTRAGQDVGGGEAFFDFPEIGLPTKLASSKGRHLKSFLYPPHMTLLLEHC